METKKKLNKKKVIVLLLIIIIICLVPVIRKTFSRYQSEATSQTDVDVAFWLVTDTVQEENLILENLVPGVTQTATFSISNNNGTLRTKSTIEYKIVITSTTNLPLQFSVYEETDGGDVERVIESNHLFKDSSGTYYREIIFCEEKIVNGGDTTYNAFELGHDQDETKNFKLKVLLPKTKTVSGNTVYVNDAALADLIECVNLRIVAQQKISE